MRQAVLTGCARRMPTQERGARRVSAIVEAAVAEFAAVGYEPATMQAIAARAGASIGSVYQFFPNKEAVARAVRTRHIQDADELWRAMAARTIPQFVERFIDSMIRFVRDHPAFLPLQDAPSTTLPAGPRHRLRALLAGILRELHPRLTPTMSARVAEIILRLNKGMMSLYAAAAPGERRWIVREYRGLLTSFLNHRLATPEPSARHAVKKGAA